MGYSGSIHTIVFNLTLFQMDAGRMVNCIRRPEYPERNVQLWQSRPWTRSVKRS